MKQPHALPLTSEPSIGWQSSQLSTSKTSVTFHDPIEWVWTFTISRCASLVRSSCKRKVASWKVQRERKSTFIPSLIRVVASFLFAFFLIGLSLCWGEQIPIKVIHSFLPFISSFLSQLKSRLVEEQFIEETNKLSLFRYLRTYFWSRSSSFLSFPNLYSSALFTQDLHQKQTLTSQFRTNNVLQTHHPHVPTLPHYRHCYPTTRQPRL